MKKLSLILIFAISSLLVVRANDTDNKLEAISEHIEIYNRVLRELELNYVDSLDYESMLQFSLDNMLYTLDPYTVYIPEKEEEDIRRMSAGEYGGIGSVVTQVEDKIYINAPYKNMAAEKAGVRAGDMILSVDGKSTKGMKVAQVSDLLRGKPGTQIVLKLRREGEKSVITKKFKREIIKIDPVPYYGMLDEETALIVFNDFIDDSYAEFKKLLNDLVNKQGAKRLVIDLRNNGGGQLSQAVLISSLFVPKGTEIVKVKGRNREASTDYITKSEPLYPDMPLAFVVGEGTASAAEILSGAMQDLDRALVFGERTFGKGLVQNIRRLPYNSYLKITTAKYYLPSGRCIQAVNYDNRKNYGRDRSIPDSLTNEYNSKNGRLFRDLSGITPDVKVESREGGLNLSVYLYAKQMYFLYANKYVAGKERIASPDKFKLTDEEYEEFSQYVVGEDFKYRLESERYLGDLQELVKYEGLDVIADSMITELKQVLKPNVDRDLKLFKDDILRLLEQEIVKRYYFQFGEIQYSLKTDEGLKVVMEYFGDEDKWNKLFEPK